MFMYHNVYYILKLKIKGLLRYTLLHSWLLTYNHKHLQSLTWRANKYYFYGIFMNKCQCCDVVINMLCCFFVTLLEFAFLVNCILQFFFALFFKVNSANLKSCINNHYFYLTGKNWVKFIMFIVIRLLIY